jgi:hypothetical protein
VWQRSPFRNNFMPSRRQSRQTGPMYLAILLSDLSIKVQFTAVNELKLNSTTAFVLLLLANFHYELLCSHECEHGTHECVRYKLPSTDHQIHK